MDTPGYIYKSIIYLPQISSDPKLSLMIIVHIVPRHDYDDDKGSTKPCHAL